jgi:hypothetical protein
MEEGVDIEPVNAIDLTAEAILQIEELRQHVRADAPALAELLAFLRTPAPSPAFLGHESISMLADVRSYAILRDSLSPKERPRTSDFREFRDFIEKYLRRLETGVTARKPDLMEEAKTFFMALNENLLSKRLSDIYRHRERVNSQHVGHDNIL